MTSCAGMQLLDDVAVAVPVSLSDTEPEREPEPVLPRGLVGLRNVGAHTSSCCNVQREPAHK